MISLTVEQLYEVIQRCERDVPKICEVICSKLKVKYSEELGTKIKNEIRSYKRYKDKLRRKLDVSVEYLNRVVIRDEDYEKDELGTV